MRKPQWLVCVASLTALTIWCAISPVDPHAQLMNTYDGLQVGFGQMDANR